VEERKKKESGNMMAPLEHTHNNNAGRGEERGTSYFIYYACGPTHSHNTSHRHYAVHTHQQHHTSYYSVQTDLYVSDDGSERERERGREIKMRARDMGL
jgi:hypothetical protein